MIDEYLAIQQQKKINKLYIWFIILVVILISTTMYIIVFDINTDLIWTGIIVVYTLAMKLAMHLMTRVD